MSRELSRVSVPSRVLELLWTDDEFYREVSGNKKISGQNKFPRCDQWCDERGFHMAFALAGYSPEDLRIDVCGNHITISGAGQNQVEDEPFQSNSEEQEFHPEEDSEYPTLTPQLVIQTGVIVRGIARRSFRARYYINPIFSTEDAAAFMKNGLLELIVPRATRLGSKNIEIMER
jgi:HSP20 family molecular chaperone IbpA